VKIIVHGPNNPTDSAELAFRVAAIHAEAVITYIQKLPLPQEDKLALLRSTYQNKRASDEHRPKPSPSASTQDATSS